MDISTWLSTYWQPLLIGAVIGLILGWLVFYLPMRGRVKRHEAESADLYSKLATSDKAVKEARQQADDAKTDLQAQQVRFNSVQGQVAALQADLEATRSQKDALDASFMERSSQMDQLQGLNEQLRSDYAGLFGQFEQAQQERDAYKASLESTTVDLGAARNDLAVSADALANKEVALNEAYLRAVKLQRELMEHQSLLAATQSELAELRRDVVSLSSLNTEMESKLQNARGDVAGELALLTSTMLRMKEESLNQANHRIAALTAELDAMRAGKVSTR
jgi:chromosome segregation ATPase